MPHEHDHDGNGSRLSEVELRVRALESVLEQKGYIDPSAIDLLIESYAKTIGPRNGARVVAKAWVDQDFKQRLLAEPSQTLASLGYAGM
jgi:nitrile hydratase